MGISTMTRLVNERSVQEAAASTPVVERGGAAVGIPQMQQQQIERSTTTALEKLAAFVPTEVIIAYVAAVGLLVPTESWHRWSIFAGAVFVLVVIILLDFELRAKRARGNAGENDSPLPNISRRRITYSVLIATVAFTVWAFAVPSGSPALDWGDGATRLFAIIAIAVSAILYRVAELIDLAPVTLKK